MNIRKLTAIVLSLLLCPTALLPAAAEEEEPAYTKGEFYSWDYKNYGDHISLTKLNYTGQVILNIPDEIDGLPVTVIEHSAVGACIYLEEIHVPENIERIEWGAFRGAPALKTVTLPASLEYLGNDAISGCESLTTVEFAGGVQRIDDYAFRDDTALTSITIPEGTEEIGTACFFGCENLAEIVMPDSIKKIEFNPDSMQFVVGRTAWLDNQPAGVIYLGKFAIGYGGNYDAPLDIVIKDGTLGISEEAFRYCSKITSVTIPDSVRYINSRAVTSSVPLGEVHLPHDLETIEVDSFDRCQITDFTIDADAPHYTVQDGVLYSKDLTKIACFPREHTEYTAPETITSIAPRTFAYAKLQTVTLPDGIPEIPEKAFYRCLNLETANLPDSVKAIEKNAFRECQSLRRIQLPQNLQTIGAVAFGHCDALEHVSFPAGLQEIGESAFCECASLREIILPDSVTSLGVTVFSSCPSLRKLRLSAGLKAVESEQSWICWDGLVGYDENNEPIYGGGSDIVYYGIVSDCPALDTLIIPKEITKIGAGTFLDQPIRDTWYTGTEDEWKQLMENEQPNTYGTVHYGYDESSELPGDLTLDNEFNLLDVVYLQRYLLHLHSLSSAAFRNADLNQDGAVDVFDLVLMKRALLNS